MSDDPVRSRLKLLEAKVSRLVATSEKRRQTHARTRAALTVASMLGELLARANVSPQALATQAGEPVESVEQALIGDPVFAPTLAFVGRLARVLGYELELAFVPAATLSESQLPLDDPAVASLPGAVLVQRALGASEFARVGATPAAGTDFNVALADEFGGDLGSHALWRFLLFADRCQSKLQLRFVPSRAAGRSWNMRAVDVALQTLIH